MVTEAVDHACWWRSVKLVMFSVAVLCGMSSPLFYLSFFPDTDRRGSKPKRLSAKYVFHTNLGVEAAQKEGERKVNHQGVCLVQQPGANKQN